MAGIRLFSPYIDYLETLVSGANHPSFITDNSTAIDAALNGQPSSELRRLVPLSDLRSVGAFFTGSRLSSYAANLLKDTFDDESVILDPACGAGDLLIACAAQLGKRKTLPQTLKIWGTKIIGRDIHSEFVQATKSRLLLAALRMGVITENCRSLSIKDIFPRVENKCGLTDYEAIKSATHIIINPPFVLADAPEYCDWVKGKVNVAALFLEACLLHANPGTRIVAILPDVLRSGSRYRVWRDLVDSRSQVHQLHIHGKFDRWADVDVFIISIVTKKQRTPKRKSIWKPERTPGIKVLQDRFEVHVGPVVDYRDPHSGQWFPFIHSRDLPPWEIICEIKRNRRFPGRTFMPPFVVVRRTSRPGDRYRAKGTIIKCDKPIAVENHLLVLLPKDGTIESCQELLKILQKQKTTNWLNERIRCRHLTVSSLADMPWWSD